jgi:HAD superfamily hydrolase (TIGR01484 family)
MSYFSKSNSIKRNSIIAFDLDGTLSRSKENISPRMADLINKLTINKKVVVISGGSIEQYNKQLLPYIKNSINLIMLPLEGSERFEYSPITKKWEMTFKKVFPVDIKKDVVDVLNRIIKSKKFDIPTVHEGAYIEDRDTEIAFSALGQNAHINEKESWDPDHKKRDKIKNIIEKEVPNVSVTIAGTTTIEVLPKGWNKAVGLNYYLKEAGFNIDDVVFVGDAIYPGGNDYPISQLNIKSYRVNGPSDTEAVIEKILLQDRMPDPVNPVAYFSMEYAINDDSSMYAGGLGVLSGDYILQAGKDNFPIVAFGLKYGDNIPEGFKILKQGNENLILSIPIGDGLVKAQVWYKEISSSGNTKLYLLDSDIPENNIEDRKITKNLYDPVFYSRLKQQIVLGIGGIKLIKILNIKPSVFHLNEGHTAFAGVGILNEMDSDDTRNIVATKHTILPEAGLFIKYEDLNSLLGKYCKENDKDIKDIFEKGKYEGDENLFSTTKFIMQISARSNGVSSAHVKYEKRAHPHSKLISITNGVFVDRWQSKDLKNIPKDYSDEDYWNTKKVLRSKMISFVKEKTGISLNNDICTLVWARRFAMYKRPYLLFSDEERIIDILSNNQYPLQIVISGKPHESDVEGKKIMDKIIALQNNPKIKGKIAYIKGYSIDISEKLVKGADIWLNTPEKGKEACGTSGMKSALNGAVQMTIPDGWAEEVNWNGKGYALPEDDPRDFIYDLLENEVLPKFYFKDNNNFDLPTEWISMSKSSINIVKEKYNTERMLIDYTQKLYRL